MADLNAEQEILLAQYKTYVRDSWGVADRRASNLRFFMVIHAGLVVGIFNVVTCPPNLTAVGVLLLISFVGYLFNKVWFAGLNNFNKLSGTKWKIVHSLESALCKSIISTSAKSPLQGPYKTENDFIHSDENAIGLSFKNLLRLNKESSGYHTMTELEKFVPFILNWFYASVPIAYSCMLIVLLISPDQSVHSLFISK